MNKIHDFRKDLADSKTEESHNLAEEMFKKYWHKNYKGYEISSLKEDLSGIDYFVILKDQTKIGIDVKFRNKDYCIDKTPDICIEDWSVIGSKEGWIADSTKKTDYILFVCRDTKRSHCYDFKVLQRVYEEFGHRWAGSQQIQRNKGYSSSCLIVPCKEIEELMIGEIIK